MPKDKTHAKYPPKLPKYPKEEDYPELYNDEAEQYEVKKPRKHQKHQELQDEEEQQQIEEEEEDVEVNEEGEEQDDEEGEGDGEEGEEEEVEEADLDRIEKDQGSQSLSAIDKFIKDKTQQPDLALIELRIQEILKILSKFNEMREESRSRDSYLNELKDCICTYYSYSKEILDIFLITFSPNELVQMIEANERQRPMTIRTNTLKTKRKELAQILINRGVKLDPLADWSKVGLKIYESKVPVGATPEYLAGQYMLQSASSFLPVIALAPQMNERILDMAAAPGGKTTYVAQLMKNTGALFANDFKKERCTALKYNIQRMGINNCIITNYDGRKFPKVMKNFDRVLLDAPCTGTGIIARDPSIKTSRGFRDVKIASHLQKELILAAIDCTKVGGYIVYSTCSVLVQENEWVVDYALRSRFVKIVDSGINIGEEGIIKLQEKRFHPSIRLCQRIYPHVHNMDGFFFVKLRKIKDGSKKVDEEKLAENKKKLEEEKLEGKTAEKKKGKKKDKKKKRKQAVAAQAEEEVNLETEEHEEKEKGIVKKIKRKDEEKTEKKSKKAKQLIAEAVKTESVAAEVKLDEEKRDKKKKSKKSKIDVEQDEVTAESPKKNKSKKITTETVVNIKRPPEENLVEKPEKKKKKNKK